MKTLFHYAASETIKSLIRPEIQPDFKIAFAPQGPSEPLLSELKDADVIWHVLQPLTEEILKRAPKLKLIQKIGVGVNTIDLDYARENGISVCNMPGTNSRAVAEMTLLLMLSCLRRLPYVDQNLRCGQWAPQDDVKDSFREIGGLTVGFIGFGHIPQILASILDAMDVSVIFANRSAKDNPFAQMPIDTVIEQADILSLHLPLTPDTEKMVDTSFLSKMKPGAILINTARGELVDETALYQALLQGHLGGAGLDVFEGEPILEGHRLFELPNVTVTPHIGWLTKQTWRRSFDIAVYNSRSVMTGAPLKHRVI